jgi:hypothetical protein
MSVFAPALAAAIAAMLPEKPPPTMTTSKCSILYPFSKQDVLTAILVLYAQLVYSRIDLL